MLIWFFDALFEIKGKQIKQNLIITFADTHICSHTTEVASAFNLAKKKTIFLTTVWMKHNLFWDSNFT